MIRAAVFAVMVMSACRAETGREADAYRPHLEPGAFVELSSEIRGALERRGCTIPQTYRDSTPHNVLRGRFTSPEQMDVAVLCATDSTTAVLVFRGGSDTSVVELAVQPHVDDRAPGDTVFWHSRAIASADSTYIRVRYERYGGPKPPEIDHEGINDIFVEKASVVWYWHRGQWLQLQGAD